MSSGLLQLLSRVRAAKSSNPTFLPAPRSPFLAVPKFDPKSVSCAFHLLGRCCPSVTIFAGHLLGTAPRSHVRDHAEGGCSHRRDSNTHVAHLALPATFHAIPKVDSRRARRHTFTHRARMARRAALVLTTHLSTFCCCLLAARTRDLLRLWHRGWAPSWPTL